MKFDLSSLSLEFLKLHAHLPKVNQSALRGADSVGVIEGGAVQVRKCASAWELLKRICIVCIKKMGG